MSAIMIRFPILLLAFSVSFLPLAASGAELPGFSCVGRYSDFLGSMNPEKRQFENSPAASYTYRIRNSVTYEHVYYGRNGKVQRKRIKSAFYGTGFAYEEKNGEYYIATNQHVAQLPDVTEPGSSVEGIPTGARKIREVLEIVRNSSSGGRKEYIPLKLVVADEALDTAVLKTRARLQVMPYRMGDSSAINSGNIVIAKGYPLGVFPATNTGRVTATNLQDTDGKWNHTDFATDALLNDGNSGSPVLAISCSTGELELVGIYHADYVAGKGMGLVVDINDLRDLLETLKVSSNRPDSQISLNAALDAVRAATSPVFMPFANHLLRIEPRGDEISLAIMSDDFPLEDLEQIVFVVAASDRSIRSIRFPERFGRRDIPWSSLDGVARDQLQRLMDAVWHQVSLVMEYRRINLQAEVTQESKTGALSLQTRIKRSADDQLNLLSAIDPDAIGAAAGISP